MPACQIGHINCGYVLFFLALLLIPSGSIAYGAESPSTASNLQRVLFLQEAQTRIVFLGTTLLGICGGLVGVFMLLRKRALIGDVVGHAALPGIAIAFIICEVLHPGGGKNLPALVGGAFLTALAGAVCVMLIERYSPLRSDAAMAMTLSLFYGFGAALFTVIQRIPTASAAGLSSYLNGKTATLVTADVWIFGIAATVLSLMTLLLWKELSLLCFDEDFASSTGWPVRFLDALLIGMVVAVTIVGMQTVGLILVVAILIIPAVSAQFWTDDLRRLMIISAVLGAVAAGGGTMISALAPRLAAGPVIVLCGSSLFIVSLLIGTQHGFIWKVIDQKKLQRRIRSHDLLRAFYERVESAHSGGDVSEPQLIDTRLTTSDLLPMRSWSLPELKRAISQGMSSKLVETVAEGGLQLTPEGAAQARRAVRNHRLWELYLITYADTAPAHADYDADRIEHILGPDLVHELEQRLFQADEQSVPASPHALNPASPSDT
ncbi:MAG TPA: iron chelate uptake ABC transporter family permease subunit [Planctomicrobium sp.]|nr:iron chelate uptake ABC transporter family permease subunit [Planctomicrobium sp.]